LSPTDPKKRFLSLLEETLKEEGFTITRDPFYGISFISDRGDVRHFFDLAVTNKEDNVEVGNLFVGVRFDAVERKVAAYEDHLPFVTDKDLARRRTLGIWLGSSDDGFSRQIWKIKDERSLCDSTIASRLLKRAQHISKLKKRRELCFRKGRSNRGDHFRQADDTDLPKRPEARFCTASEALPRTPRDDPPSRKLSSTITPRLPTTLPKPYACRDEMAQGRTVDAEVSSANSCIRNRIATFAVLDLGDRRLFRRDSSLPCTERGSRDGDDSFAAPPTAS
jgi:hypothetical protein